MKNNNNSFWGGTKNLILGSLFVFGMFGLLYKLTDYSRYIKTISHSVFWDKVENGQVRAVRITGQDVQGILKDGTRFEVTIGNDPHLWERLRQKEVDINVTNTSSQFSIWYLIPIFIALMLLAWYFSRQSRGSGNGGSGNIFSMSKSKARLFMPSTIKDTFESVAGAAEAKEELKDVVDFLKNPEKYERLGARITRGVLLVGAPGNGKTLLARAVAGEATCPFFSVSGSDFVEVFVGVGAARVRDLFAQARKHAPCIIFIDEIDAIGRQRGAGGVGGGHDEREQTLNQLLTEMDGFQTDARPIIVMGATNIPDVLDTALRRPGRFDRQVIVPYPDLLSRKQILEVHVKPVKIAPDVDLSKIARGTPKFSGADLANLVNEAAIIASKENKEQVTMADFEEARDKILLGKEHKTLQRTEESRRITAYHEAGHALMILLMPEHTDPLHKITIMPRGRALGVTFSLPEGDNIESDKERMLAFITMCVGGRAAEEIVFSRIGTGPHDDFKQATNYARAMVCSYGMSDALGMVNYTQQYNEYAYSQATAQLIDTEVKNIINNCYQRAKDLIIAHREMLEKLAGALLEKETMDAAEVYELLGIQPRADLRFIIPAGAKAS